MPRAFFDCPIDTWTRVASNVTAGTINIVKTNAQYIQTFVAATGLAPTNNGDGEFPLLGLSYLMNYVSGADVYILCRQHAGRVSVDT